MHDNFTISHEKRKHVLPRNHPVKKIEFISKSKLQKTVFDGAFYKNNSETYQALYMLAKRGIDIFISILLLILTSPLIAVIAVLIKTTSAGPVIYKHRRIGKFGVKFDCWKFRTMVSNADDVLRENPKLLREFNEKFKIDKDPRITKIGKFLRTSSLDELPQLLQVLQGKMTLVGPRPVIERELNKYSTYQNKLLSVKPGLSGLWQVSGRSKTTYKKRVLLDMEYIEQRSLSLDLQILLLTITTVIKKTGAL